MAKKLQVLGKFGEEQVQADWNQTDSTKADYIKNKPDVGQSSETVGKLYRDETGAVCGEMFNVTEVTDGDNYAPGFRSHAEGLRTSAEGGMSHAEGEGTTASNDCSHAEGQRTSAGGYASHAEGDGTIASGLYSHAEGSSTTASGETSHAEGFQTQALGAGSHAEGFKTQAEGERSHAEGSSTLSGGYASHAEGEGTTASGDYSHAEGDGTTASNEFSHAEGEGTTSSGGASHAEGDFTTAGGYASHAEGSSTTASGSSSHAEGSGTIARGANSHVQGRNNVEDPDGKYAHIVGNGTDSNNRSNAHTLDWEGNAFFAGAVEGTSLTLKSPAGKHVKITPSDSGGFDMTSPDGWQNASSADAQLPMFYATAKCYMSENTYSDLNVHITGNLTERDKIMNFINGRYAGAFVTLYGYEKQTSPLDPDPSPDPDPDPSPDPDPDPTTSIEPVSVSSTVSSLGTSGPGPDDILVMARTRQMEVLRYNNTSNELWVDVGFSNMDTSDIHYVRLLWNEAESRVEYEIMYY